MVTALYGRSKSAISALCVQIYYISNNKYKDVVRGKENVANLFFRRFIAETVTK